MALEIFKLVGSIFVDSDAADKSLQKTDKKAMGVGSTLGKGIKTAAKWGTAIIGGATAAVGAVVNFANKTSDAADEIDKMSQRLGISREAYQELDFALSQSGVDITSFSSGAKTLLKNMDAVTEGNKTAISNFEKLGISVVDSEGKMRSQEEVLWDAISAFQGMEDSAEKSRLAQELFGKQGQEMLPLLNAQSGSIEEMRQQAHDLGLVLSDEVIDSGVSLHDTMDQLKRSFESVATKLGATVMPLVENLANFILDHMPEIEGMFNELAPVLSDLFSGLGPPLMDLAMMLLPVISDLLSAVVPVLKTLVTDLLMPLISGVLPIIVNLIQQILPVAMQIINAFLPILVQILTTILPVINELLDAFMPVILEIVDAILPLLVEILDALMPILDLMISLLEPILDLFFALMDPILDLIHKAIGPLGDAFGAVAGILTSVFATAIDWLKEAIGNVKDVFNGIITFLTGVFTGNWRKAWDGVKQIFSSIWEGIKNGFKAPINFIISGINKFLSGLNNIKIPDWVPVVGGKGFHISTIPYLAKGGVLERGQTGFLEGDGAEAVVPLENNRRWIRAVAEDMNGAIGGSHVEALLSDILDKLIDLTNMGIYLDGKKLVGGLADPMDRKLGRLQAQKARG